MYNISQIKPVFFMKWGTTRAYTFLQSSLYKKALNKKIVDFY